MFQEQRDELMFCWSDLGNIARGRPNLGDHTTVTAYRLLQYTIRDVLIKHFGPDNATRLLYEAGQKAGVEFCKNLLDTRLEQGPFIAQLQQVLKDQGIGILRMENTDENGTIILSIYEDLDCSGLPLIGETVCSYDEGFISGIFQQYFGRPYTARETTCWGTGSRVCRFEVTIDKSSKDSQNSKRNKNL